MADRAFTPSAGNKSLLFWKDYFWSWRTGRRQAGEFKDVSTYCMFIGHGRSGHSLFGTLLNAHPDAVVSHELDALYYIDRGLSREQLYALILKRDRWFTGQGSEWHGYNYRVPNQWQGRFRKLKVVGDKKGGVSTARLKKDPGLLDKLRRTVRVPVKLIHVIRNPFDNLSTMVRHGGRPLEENVGRFFEASDINERLMKECGPDMITLRHEEIIAHPKENLKTLVEFVGLTADDQYFTDCASLIFVSPSKSRSRIEWPAESIKLVQAEIDRRPFLHGYSFES
jgi:hypothetical protein